MPAPNLEGMINIYDIMSSTRDAKTNTLTCQIGNAITGEVYSDNAQLWGPLGLASLPSNVAPNPQDAAQVITLARSVGGDLIIGTRDVRNQGTYGKQFGPGDTCLYANGPDGTGQPRILLKGDTGAINLFTKASPTATSMGIYMNPDTDQISILNSKGHGIIIDQTGVHIVAGASNLDLSVSGFVKLTGSKVINIHGEMLILGDPLDPSLNPLTSSALSGPTGFAAIPNPKVLISKL
jgi:hypothetical protein